MQMPEDKPESNILLEFNETTLMSEAGTITWW